MNDSVTVKSPAKINLTLDIVGKRNDGYHFMKTIMQSVSLFDNVTVTLNKSEKTTIHCNNKNVPCNEKNIAFKAVNEFLAFTGKRINGIDIDIDKNIPIKAGLAGGSADASAVIVALDYLFETGLKKHELCEIGVKVGADVPFCIIGGTAVAEGIGELITPLPSLDKCFLVLAKGTEGISTAEAFKKIDDLVIVKHPDTNGMIAAIAVSSISEFAPRCMNVFEAITNLEDVSNIKNIMLHHNALSATMSGSGSAVFGIFEKKKYVSSCIDELEKHYDFVKLCYPVNHGPIID